MFISSAMNYVPSRKAQEILGVSEKTLRNWDGQGKIKTIRTPTGHRRYDVQDFLQTAGDDNRVTVLYARVSSYKQKDDLQRQANELQSRYPEGEIITEVGGGLNYKRKKLLSLLERIHAGAIKRVVVAHKDRLSRFGYELFEFYCRQNRTELVVLNIKELSPEEEIVEDILTVLHCYSSRIYGLRKYRSKMQEDPSLPHSAIDDSVAKLD